MLISWSTSFDVNAQDTERSKAPDILKLHFALPVFYCTWIEQTSKRCPSQKEPRIATSWHHRDRPLCEFEATRLRLILPHTS